MNFLKNCFHWFFMEKSLFQNKELICEGIDFQFYKVAKSDTNTNFCARISTKPIDNFFKNEVINLYREINIIPHLNHASISKFVFYSTNDFSQKHCPTLITEFYSNGPLTNFLSQKNPSFNDTKKLISIYGIASGMSYLHSHDILHCDLKSSNIYFDDKMIPKIAGFHISKQLASIIPDDNFFIKGTPAYLAPEIYSNEGSSKASDVYSFSFLIYEIITNEKPFKNYENVIHFFNEVIQKGVRPQIDSSIPDCYRELIERCWSENPSERPTFDQIVTELKTNKKFITEKVDEKEFCEYIQFIENSENTYESTVAIPSLEEVLESQTFKEFDLNIKFKGIYETELNNLALFLKLKAIEKFTKLRNIAVNSFVSVIEVSDNDTGIHYIAKNRPYKKKTANFIYYIREVSFNLRFDHPCVCKCIGYNPLMKTRNNKNTGTIYLEKYSNGSLEDILDLEKKDVFMPGWNNTQKLIVIYGIASGMSYLHSRNVVHRDLKPSNVLLDDNAYPKICDFGYAKELPGIVNRCSKGSLSETTYNYMAPEIFKDLNYTKKSDVFAFAAVWYKLFTKEPPFNEQPVSKVAYSVIKGERQQMDERIPECYQNLISKCWLDEPSERPSFEDILQELENNKQFIIEDVNEERYHKYINHIKDPNNSLYFPDKEEVFNLLKKEEKQIKLSVNLKPINLSNFEKKEKIGQGSFGKVYKVVNKKTRKIFACKISILELDFCSDLEIENIERELNIMSQIKSPSIIKFIGYNPMNFKNQMRPTMITEFIPNGTLDIILKLERKGLSNDNWNDTKKLINIYGIACGMSYLHSHNYLHRDLKPANVFLDDYLFPIIGDFGLSKEIAHEKINGKKSGLKGTCAYIAPEIFNENKYDKSGDVYSFAMIVYEIMTNNILYENLNHFQVMINVINGFRPKLSNEIPSCYQKLIEDCWEDDPKRRPTFDQIVEILRNDQEFITETVDKNEFYEYIEYIEGDVSNIKLAPTVSIDLNLAEEDEDEEVDDNNNNNEVLKKGYVDLRDFEKVKLIRKSEFSKFYEIKNIKNGLIYFAKFMTIVIAKLKKDEILNLTREVNIISQLNHPCCLKFIGYSPTDYTNKRKPVIITELAKNGCLSLFLSKEREEKIDENWNETSKLILIYGVACGMSYLHSHNILHRDLTPESVFLDDKMNPKIGNFGLSTKFHTLQSMTFQSTAGIKGKPAYLSPEILQLNEFSKAGDVYSFAMLVFEIVSNSIPFRKIEGLNQLFDEVVIKGNRPEFNQNVPDCYRRLIEICWAQNPEDRPSFDDIENILRKDDRFISEKVDKNRFDEYVHFIEESKIEFNSNDKILDFEEMLKLQNEEEKSDSL